MKHLGWFLLLAVAGCGEDANVEGNWTMAVTNRDNGCNLDTWQVGNQSSGITVQITQESSNVTATITGFVGIYVSARLGSNVFTGDVEGDSVVLDLFGTRGHQSGNCSFTYNSTIDGDITGDTMTGRIEYRAATNGNPDCASLAGCVSFQEFNGTRPPT